MPEGSHDQAAQPAADSDAPEAVVEEHSVSGGESTIGEVPVDPRVAAREAHDEEIAKDPTGEDFAYCAGILRANAAPGAIRVARALDQIAEAHANEDVPRT